MSIFGSGLAYVADQGVSGLTTEIANGFLPTSLKGVKRHYRRQERHCSIPNFVCPLLCASVRRARDGGGLVVVCNVWAVRGSTRDGQNWTERARSLGFNPQDDPGVVALSPSDWESPGGPWRWIRADAVARPASLGAGDLTVVFDGLGDY